MARVLLKGTFGGTPDAIYPVMRNLVNENLGRFPIKEVIDYYRGKRKSISFTNDDIENILNYDYGSARTYCALTLLYPALNYSFKYHQDHIHPKSFFSKRNLQNRGIVDPDLFILKYNKLPNLQLLQPTLNLEKNSKEFKDWLSSVYPNSTDQSTYLLQNHIDTEVSLDFVDFHDFFEKRKTKLKSLLKGVLNVTNEEVEAISEE